MDSANKQTAIIAEVTQGTTPATPAFLLTRDIRVSGAPQRPNNRSPERRADRMAASMVLGLSTYPKTIEMPWVRDAATDVLWESLHMGTWTANVLKNASTKKFFTLEEKYEGGATDPYRRTVGCMVDSASISFRNGEGGMLSFGLKALSESTATTAIASSTYAAPTPGYDPSTPADIVVNGLFGTTTPRVKSLNMTITNKLEEEYGFGSPNPAALGLGEYDISGTVEFYFSVLADYSNFVTKQTGLSLDLTIGATTLYKDRILLPNCDVWNPNIDDPGQTGSHTVSLQFMAKYYASSTAAITHTRLVA